MARTWLVLISVLALAVSACGGPGASPGPASPGTDMPSPGGLTGTIKLVGWSAAQVEDDLLREVLDTFEELNPGVTVEFEQIASEYETVMLTRLASGPDAGDLFYVPMSRAQIWIDEGVLMPLDDMAEENGFGLDAFYEPFMEPFQRDGQTYGFPKDSSMLGMQTNDRLLQEAGVEIPTTIEELETAARALQDTGVDAPMCFAAEWQRAGAFMHAFGGGMVDDAGQPILDSDESRAGLEWYLRMYEEGLAAKAPDVGAGWCGEAFFRENVAIAFEGNWIGPVMETDAPDIAYTVSAIPAGPAGSATLVYTNAYGMHADARNPELSWALLAYLTGQEGMQEWVDGGLVLPSRSDVQATGERLPTYAEFAEFAQPGEGFTPRWPDVNNAFNPALDSQASGGYSADAVIDAALPVLQEVTGQ